jgi:hypothetical protein
LDNHGLPAYPGRFSFASQDALERPERWGERIAALADMLAEIAGERLALFVGKIEASHGSLYRPALRC